MPISAVNPTPRREAGLSRLEIMLALTVVALLVTVLLGRLGELNGLARPMRLQAAMAAVQASASVFHARCQSQRLRSPQDDCSRVEVDGVAVAGVHDWPAASAEGIGRAASLTAAGRDAFRLRPTDARGTPALSIGLGDRACEFLYVQASRPDVTPVVDIVDASCH
jgi:hypothetical protein